MNWTVILATALIAHIGATTWQLENLKDRIRKLEGPR